MFILKNEKLQSRQNVPKPHWTPDTISVFLSIFISWAHYKNLRPLPFYLKVIFQPVMKACPVREGGQKVTMSQSRGQELLGNGMGRTTVGHLGATSLHTFLPRHFLSITIQTGESWKVRCCRSHGNGHKLMSKHSSVLPLDFQLGHGVKFT